MTTIQITAHIKANIQTVFSSYLNPADNLRWNTAGEGWTTNFAEINPTVGGEFHIGYKSPDEKNDFDFSGKYTEIIENQLIKYTLGDDREVQVIFENDGENTVVTTHFETEDENTAELQKTGWNQILLNFKTFVEKKANPKNQSLTKTIEIKASKEKVWQVLLEDTSYRQWTSAFTEGSYYEGEMKYDGKIKFLSPSGSGISSKIVVFIPNYQISFKHLGAIIKGEEDFESSEFEGWKGSRETYTLTENNEITTLEIYVELTKEDYKQMREMWERALVLVKKLCEE